MLVVVVGNFVSVGVCDFDVEFMYFVEFDFEVGDVGLFVFVYFYID